MNQRWSLDSLYKSFESKEFTDDMNELYNIIEDIKKWTNENLSNDEKPRKKIEDYLNFKIRFNHVSDKIAAFAHLTSAVEAKNEKAQKITEELQRKISELTAVNVKFQKWVGNLENLEEIIEESELIKEHEFFIKELIKKNNYLLSEQEEAIIASMENTGSKAWGKLQNVLSSTLMVDIHIHGEDKQLPLSVVRSMAFDSDKEIRRNAYEAELLAYGKIEESSAACLNGIKGEVITISKMRGFKSPLEQTIINSRMDEETLIAMMEAIKENLPYFHKYYLKKTELLGNNNGLPFYDIFAPVGESDKNFTYEEAKNFIVKNFKTFSDKLSEFAKNAFDNRWIDAEPRQGKRGGAFCSQIVSIKECRICCNFSGKLKDVITIAHELGHGYHGQCLKNQSNLNCSYPMPIAETASIFCETIVKNAVLKDVSDKDKITILESSICDAGQVIVDIYSRFLFESELFKRREKGSLSVNELKEIMVQAQKEAYGGTLDENYLHPYAWANKPHYYYPARNFYNFPYAFGLLFSKGLYSEYLKRGEEFVIEYDKLLSVTGKMDITSIAAMMNIDIHSLEFWRGSIDIIKKDIDKFIELA